MLDAYLVLSLVLGNLFFCFEAHLASASRDPTGAQKLQRVFNKVY